jgi:PAS domain S-box-containing protein
VSSLRRTEESLLRSEERFRLAIEGSRDGLWDWNLQTNEAFHSDRFATMLGYEPGELPYTGEAWSALLHPEDRDEALRRVDEHLQGKTEIYESVFRMRAKDGSYRWINGRGKATFDENGTPVRLVGFNTDITERIRKEEELRRTLNEKDYLLQELNHRVKNNLVMVSSLIQLKDNNLGEEVDLSDIARQVDAIRIIHEKLYQHKQTDHIDMRDYVQEILSTVFSYPSLNIRIENEVDHISLDTRTAVTVGLIVNEIATNAVKHGFTEGSEETFHAEMRRDGPDGSLFLELSNTGRPFPEDVDFENPDSLGLQLIHSLGAQLDGRLELRKEPYPVFTLSFSSE